MRGGRLLSQHLGALIEEHGVSTDGVLHIGANRGQEAETYRRIGFDVVRMVEPIPEAAREIPGGVEVIQAAVTDRPGPATFHIPADTRFASLLEPKKRRVARRLTVPTVRLDAIAGGVSVLVVDVQGAELEVLRSGDLSAFGMVVVETCTLRRYRGAALRGGILDFMADRQLVAEYRHKTKGVSDCVFV